MAHTVGELSVADAHHLINHIQNNPEDCENEKDVIQRAFNNLVHSIAQKYRLVSADDYEDFVQVGYVGLFKAVKEFKSDAGAKFSTFANTVIVNTVIEYLRSELKHTNNKHCTRYFPTENNDSESLSIEEIAESQAGADETFENKTISKIDASRLQSALHQAVLSLPERQRQAVGWFFYRGKTKSEVAKKLKVSRPRVSALLNDAIHGLRRRIQIAV